MGEVFRQCRGHHAAGRLHRLRDRILDFGIAHAGDLHQLELVVDSASVLGDGGQTADDRRAAENRRDAADRGGPFAETLFDIPDGCAKPEHVAGDGEQDWTDAVGEHDRYANPIWVSHWLASQRADRTFFARPRHALTQIPTRA